MNLALKVDCELRGFRCGEVNGRNISPLKRKSDAFHKPGNLAIVRGKVSIPFNYLFIMMLHINRRIDFYI